MAREDPQLKLRLTNEMKDAVSEAARANGRSVNTEIVVRLTQSFAGDFVAAEDLSNIQSSSQSLIETTKQLAQSLIEAAQRESDLVQRANALIDALSQAQANNEKLIALLEAKIDVSQKA